MGNTLIRLPQPVKAGKKPALSTLRFFFLIYVPAALLLLSGLAIWRHLDTQQALVSLEARESARVGVAADLMFHALDDVATDLLLLASNPCMQRFVDHGNSADLRCIESFFADMVREKQFYDQARFLDDHGMEVVRINLVDKKAALVPPHELQPKGDRYYFRDAIVLARRDIYLSPLDLNIEHRQIEVPYKPMLRIATPIMDNAGKTKGVVVLNLLGDVLLSRFREAMKNSPQPMLLNRDGYWLSHPQAEKSWGFMFGDRNTLATEAQEDWRRLKSADSGRFIAPAGMYSFATVYPLQAGRRLAERPPNRDLGDMRLADKGYFWKVVSLVPAEQLPSNDLFNTPQRLVWILAGGLLLALLVAPVARVSANRAQLQQELEGQQRQLEEITATLGEGLLTLDGKGLIVFANPAAEKLLGWSRDGLLGQRAHALFHHHHQDKTPLPEEECPILRLLTSGENYRSEQQVFWRQDGTPIPVAVHACALMHGDRPAGVVVAFQDVTEQLRAQEKVRDLAFHDTVTGLPNRHLLFDRLTQVLAQASRHQRPLALLFMDLDGFKQVNDTFGHAGGDQLLYTIAQRIVSAVRASDTVARQGGDEFVVLLAELAAPEDAGEVAKKILDVCREPVIIDGQAAIVSVSIGIAIASGVGEDADKLVQKADKAMYVAKAAGRNTFRYFTSA